MAPYELKLSDQEAAERMSALVRARLGEQYYCVIEVDHFYAC